LARCGGGLYASSGEELIEEFPVGFGRVVGGGIAHVSPRVTSVVKPWARVLRDELGSVGWFGVIGHG
jgi:hypothetical protein